MDICAFYLEFYCGIIEKTILRQIPVILLDFYLCVLGLKQSRVNTCQGLYSMLRYQGSRGHNHVRRFWDTNTGVNLNNIQTLSQVIPVVNITKRPFSKVSNTRPRHVMKIKYETLSD